MDSAASDFSGPSVFLAIGLFILVYSLPKFLLAQRIRNTPTSKVRSAAIGLAELYGKPVLGRTVVSPISGEDCLYWRIVAQYAPLIIKDPIADICDIESQERFFLDDGTGRMPVDPRGANISGLETVDCQDRLSNLLSSKEHGGRIRQFIEGLEPGLRDSFMSHKNDIVGIIEYRLPQGKDLYVLGDIDLSEGRSSAENLVVRRKALMFISPGSEKEALKETGRTAMVLVLLGSAVTVASLIMLAIRLSVF